MSELLSLSVAELGAAFRDRTLSPVEVTTRCLERIDATDGVIGAFVEVTAEAALAQARAAESAFGQGVDRGPVQGIPVGIKDLVDVAGVPTGAGSPLREGRVADADAEVITRLRAGGAVLLGKTRTDPFAYGASTRGTVNPWAPTHVAGGSSGGSAAAVAAGQCSLAIGTDTAGSVRIPASLCGVVGFKAAHGSVPRRGAVPLSWSFDNIGPIGRSVSDVAAMFTVMAGLGGETSSPRYGRPEWSAGNLTGLRIGVPTDHFVDDIDPEVHGAVREVLDHLEGRGASLVPVSIPMGELYEAVLYAMLLPEAAAYHSADFPARAEQYPTQLRKALTIGSGIAAVDYVQAQRLRGLIRDSWGELFRQVDFVVAPTVPMPAPPLTQRYVEWPSGRSESTNSALVRFSLAGNLSGFPAISLPCGLSTQGLPLGVQLLAGPGADLTLLDLAATLEPELGRIGSPPHLGPPPHL